MLGIFGNMGTEQLLWDNNLTSAGLSAAPLSVWARIGGTSKPDALHPTSVCGQSTALPKPYFYRG